VDVLVVPALAVDARGRRLGRGKGHYDATLSAFAGRSVALVYDTQLVPEVPVGDRDRAVDAVCTESRLIVVKA
jgi:5-formyltetrahydrofolate cyclo-ligase